ncbi:protein FAM174C [Diretmus argenteus]
MAEDVTKPAITTVPKHVVTNSSGFLNSTKPGGRQGTSLPVDGPMMQRALYVLIGITAVGVLYFLVRAVRLKKPSQKKKYGLLANYDDSVEMEALDSDEDETVYEARSLRRTESCVAIFTETWLDNNIPDVAVELAGRSPAR